MNKHRLSLTLLLFFITSAAAITACEEAASRFTDRTINNLENEVGGAAERSQDRAADQAGGAICGSNAALIAIFVGMPTFIVLRKSAPTFDPRGKRRQLAQSSRIVNSEKRKKEEDDG
jgi:hypothetical protein